MFGKKVYDLASWRELFTVPDAESTGTVKVNPGIPMIYDSTSVVSINSTVGKERSRSHELVRYLFVRLIYFLFYYL